MAVERTIERERSGRARRTGAPCLAALDLGTNNCRLLVAEPTAEGFNVVDSFSRITRLGEGLATTGRLMESAMARTLSALRVCRRVMDRNGIVHARCVATEACRRAANGADFVARVERAVGNRLEVLGHEEEAALAMLGCLPLVDAHTRHLLMVDIGGGSTEILWLDRAGGGKGRIAETVSVPLGVVTLSESFGRRLANGAYDDAVGYVGGLLTRALKAGRQPAGLPSGLSPGLPDERTVQMLGTSGTVTTLAAVHLGLRRYDRRKVDGIRLPFAAIADVGRRLRGLDEAARAAHPCVGAERADLVVAGCAILDAIHAHWPVASLRVADRGVREGILSALTGRSLRQALFIERETLPS